MSVTIREVFEAMPGRFNSDAADSWQADIQFHFDADNDGENWFISINEGACSVSEGKHDAPSATINTTSDTWIGMITGSVNPMQAFMTGK
ncbi:MAG: SCP2 sterol-binding domain-containing protein, partial [Myxococcota bacterium]|nr:SCP2 sterol-binding domain-containing protein [Myxococcota bacterium]